MCSSMNALRRSLNSEQRSLGWKSMSLLCPGARLVEADGVYRLSAPGGQRPPRSAPASVCRPMRSCMRQIGSASDASASCTRRRAPRPGRLLLGVLASALALGLLGCGGGSARDDAGALARVSPVHGGTPAPGPGAGHAIGGDRRPNIVFVLTDDLAENLVA